MSTGEIIWTDTHAHLYAEEFDNDRTEMISRAVDAGVKHLYLPNIDENSIDVLHQLCEQFPQYCRPMMGLHPCYVKEEFKTQLERIEKLLFSGNYAAVGEIGLDLYWDQSSLDRQKEALKIQLGWAKTLKLPVSLHTREATRETIDMIYETGPEGLRGVFHCFSGSADEAREITDMDFALGIGGVVTFKNSHLQELLKDVSLEKIVLETDAPYLAPAPHRGKRNESSYIPLIAAKLAEIYSVSAAEIAEVTSRNARLIFQ